MIVKARPQFPDFFLRDYTKEYIRDPLEVHLYLVSKVEGTIIGHVMGTLIGTVTNSVSINQLEVSVKYRNKRICSTVLIPSFVRLTEFAETYDLVNTGKENSCKCYKNAFGKLRYEYDPECSVYMIFKKKRV